METRLTYAEIVETLFSEDIEEYVPDGISVSHPIVGFCDGKVVDCFLLYVMSVDRRKYSPPIAMITIDSERKELVEYKSFDVQTFRMSEGTDYFLVNELDSSNQGSQDAEITFQDLYLKTRKVAFRNNISSNEIEVIRQYLKFLRMVELECLLPYLLELGRPFVKWVKELSIV
jgi:hypothetical protein